jgi:hypothetical protein
MARSPRPAFAAVAAMAILIAGCGSSSSSSTSQPGGSTVAPTSSPSSSGSTSPVTSSAELCAARDNLKSSIEDLKNVDVVKNGTSSLQPALRKVKDNLQTVKSLASQELQPKVQAFETALNQLESALKDVGSAGVSGVATAATDAARSGDELLTSLDALRCS